MIKDYGMHPAQDCAIAGNNLRNAVRELATNADVGLGLAANVLDQVADVRSFTDDSRKAGKMLLSHRPSSRRPTLPDE